MAENQAGQTWPVMPGDLQRIAISLGGVAYGTRPRKARCDGIERSPRDQAETLDLELFDCHVALLRRLRIVRLCNP